MNFQMFQLELEKAEEPEIKLPTSIGSQKKQENSRKDPLLLHWLGKAFDCVDQNKLWEILKETGIQDHLTCLQIYLHAGQKARVKTGYGTTDCFQIGKGVCQGCILPACLFNLYAEYIMQNARLDEEQSGIKIVRGKFSNLRYADDTTLMAENKEQKHLLMQVHL